MITVKGTGTDGKVILWERDAKHPKGEVFIANDGNTYKVSPTARIQELLKEGVLVKGEESSPVPPLRKATEVEEENAEPPLEEPVAKETARVITDGILRKGGRPPGRKNKAG